MFLPEEASRPIQSTSSTADEAVVAELPLPHDFLLGSATAAYQIEGAAFQDGKGPSIWDEFAHLNPSRTNGKQGDVACDHYNRVDEDLDLMTNYGLEAYRFSIAWSRMIPLGGRNDPVNEKGVAFYNKLIDGLIARGIKPKRYGGMLNTSEFQADYVNFARLCFMRFGDRVSQWITFNEPYIISVFGFHNGIVAPGRSAATGHDSATEPFLAAHSIILAHAATNEVYAQEFQATQKGSVSIVLNSDYYEPFDRDSEADKAAAERRLVFYLSWFADPIYLGADYPKSMRDRLGARLPEFTEAERQLLKRTAPNNTIYGMNHYTSQFARARTTEPAGDDLTGNVEELAFDSNGMEIGPPSGVSWLRVTQVQFRKLLGWIWNRENDMTVEEAVNDEFRVRYFGLYLDEISRATYEDGVKVSGYFAWSLMDNYGKFRPTATLQR
ncbi:hypothetical protein QWA68_016645 [Fusarium oxysporum]|nr:hypothetical protein QWA68_016645 [Fusarium oxysporum]